MIFHMIVDPFFVFFETNQGDGLFLHVSYNHHSVLIKFNGRIKPLEEANARQQEQNLNQYASCYGT